MNFKLIPASKEENGCDGDAGHTFETLIGVPENNNKFADFKGYELKVKVSLSTLITCLTSTPPGSTRYIYENFSYEDKKNRKVFFKDSSMNLPFSFIKTDSKLILKDGETFFGEWNYSDLSIKLINKLTNLVVIEAIRKKIDGKKYFIFTKITLYTDFNVDQFWEEILNTVRVDFRIGYSMSKGCIHDRGTAFRVKMENLMKFYQTKEILLEAPPHITQKTKKKAR